MNKKSKEIVKKLCFTLVIVISIITIIGCPNTVSNKTNSGAGSNGSNPPPPPPPPSTDPNDWSGLTAEEIVKRMQLTDKVIYSQSGLGFGMKNGKLCYGFGKSDNAFTADQIKNACAGFLTSNAVIQDGFASISDGLNSRSTNFKSDNYYSTIWVKYFAGSVGPSPSTFVSPNPVGVKGLNFLYQVFISSFGFVVHNPISAKSLSEVGFCTYIDISAPIDTYADWEIVFIRTDGSSDLGNCSCSFHFGPYLLTKKDYDVEKDKDGYYNPGFAPGLQKPKYNHKVFHEFTLKAMVSDYLGKKRVNVSDELLRNLPIFMEKNRDNYDVYLVLTFSNLPLKEVFCFRNVIKLTDPTWRDNWN